MNSKAKSVFAQMLVTLLGAAAFITWVIPWMTGRMQEVADRPKIRMQQQLEAQRLERERRFFAERELMKNVNKLRHDSLNVSSSVPISEVVIKERVQTDTVLSVEDTAEFEDAWVRWYKSPSDCRDGGNTVECANDFVQKRREFKRLYTAGKVR